MRKVRFASPTNSPFSAIVSITLPFSSLIAKDCTRSPSGLSSSKLNARPLTWGKLPGVAPSPLSATPCSMISSSSWAVTVSRVKPLLKRREFSMSSWEISPASFPASGFARVGPSSPVKPSMLPISARIPPPFLMEITTESSAAWAAAKFASAVRLPKLVSSVRTSVRLPSRKTSLWPKMIPSLWVTTFCTSAVRSWTCWPLLPSANASAILSP